MATRAEPWRHAVLDLVDLVPERLRRRARRWRNHTETVTTDAELDARLDRATQLFARSDDEARALLASFELAPPAMPDDPFSPAYAAAQWDLYRRVSGRDDYQVSNERSPLDVSAALLAPYPHSTGSAVQVADQFGAIAFIIRTLKPRPGMRVVEFGPGWGNLTLQFPRMGIDTTAVEVDPGFAELLRRASLENPRLRVVQTEMLAYQPELEAKRMSGPEPERHPAGRHDAAVFFESFHHCADHLRMLERLASIVTDDGVVVFAGEPVGAFPFPWGLRLDGLSLWSTRVHGWLELGFDRRYFDAALARTGWQGHRFSARSVSPLAHLTLAHRARRAT